MNLSEQNKGRILLVDDDPNVTAGMMRGLVNRFDVLAVSSAVEGLRILDSGTNVAVVISDLCMPGMDGIAFLSEVNRRSPETIRILLTGCEADAATALDAVNKGQVYRYLVKPCPQSFLGDEIDSAYMRYLSRAEEKKRAAKAESEAAANRAKSQFLAEMSHGIRTPMNAVIALSSLLLETSLSADQKESVQIIRESAEGLLGIVNDILDFSKIEAGAMVLEYVPFEIRSTVESVRRMFAIQAEQKGVSMRADIDTRMPDEVSGDPTRLRQILVNLLGNALKFTDAGAVGIKVRTVRIEGDDAFVDFEVWDTGIGMSEETQRHIFKDFVQADASTTRRYGGTGLGLSISKRLVEAMGGELSVQSNPGKGSLFQFSLHFSICGAVADAADDSESGDNEETTFEKSREFRILVADDNLINRRVTAMLLEKLGYPSEVVENGLEAVNAVKETWYDLILMDMEMPVMNGIESAGEIRAAIGDLRNPGIKIIGLTGHADGAMHAAMLKAGMDDCLTKPMLIDSLRAALTRHLGDPGSLREFAESRST